MKLVGSSWLKTICYVRLLASGVLNCGSVNTRLRFSDWSVGMTDFSSMKQGFWQKQLKDTRAYPAHRSRGVSAHAGVQRCRASHTWQQRSGGGTWDSWLSLSHIYFSHACRPLHRTPTFREVPPVPGVILSGNAIEHTQKDALLVSIRRVGNKYRASQHLFTLTFYDNSIILFISI